jgi:hypothetical protein
VCVALAAAAWAAVMVFAADRSATHVARAKEVVLVYVGAEDCAPCRAWQAQGEVALRASPEFARLTYRAVKSPTLFDVMSDAHWPDDLKIYRERLGDGAGVPAWLVVADGEIVMTGQGASQWDKIVLPKVRSLLR